MQLCKVLIALVACTMLRCGTTGGNQPVAAPCAVNLAGTVITSDSVYLNRALGLVFYQGCVFTGTVTSRYSNDTIAASIDYVLGKRHGSYQKWFENGRLSYSTNYVNGKQNGKATSWWRNGNIRSEAHFVAGVPEGVQTQYYQSGSLFKKMHLVNGKEQGRQQSWRENGKLYNNYEAKNGRVFGLKRSKLCFKLSDENIVFNE